MPDPGDGRRPIQLKNVAKIVPDMAPAEVTHLNLNDQTVEGLRFKTFAGMSVQYHPEASPGPHDSRYLFDQFLRLIAENNDVSVLEAVEVAP